MDEINNIINALVELIHYQNKHWWIDVDGRDLPVNIGEKICLMHSELSEALEAVRRDAMDDKLPHRKGLEVELADCMIRIMDFAGAMDLDLGGAIKEKLEYNQIRADHSYLERAKEGGKKF